MHTNKHEFRKTTLAQPKARSKNPKKNLSRFTTADTEDTEKVKKQNPKPTTETRRKPQTRTKGKAAKKVNHRGHRGARRGTGNQKLTAEAAKKMQFQEYTVGKMLRCYCSGQVVGEA